jgi:signal peptidase II
MAAFWAAALVVFALDRAAKMVAIRALLFGEAVPVLRGVLEWRLTQNRGMALGLLSGNLVAITVLPVLVVFVGFIVLRRYRATPYTWLATGLVLGGFLGNLVDRVTAGYVLDMVYFPWMPWYICNFADIAICLGVALLVVSILFRPQDWRLKGEKNACETDDSGRPV